MENMILHITDLSKRTQNIKSIILNISEYKVQHINVYFEV